LRALLYDIHGNRPALDAVLEDADRAGAQSFVLGGDYALFGAWPTETVERLRDLDATWIRGNTERWLATPADAPGQGLIQRALDDCAGKLGNDRIHELALLPERVEIDEVLFCHASPRSDMETFEPKASDGDAELLAGAGLPVIVFGHSHLQFTRAAGERLLVNPGSVGMPLDGDHRAAYALWRGKREIELRRVEYDHEAYAKEVRARLALSLGEDVETLVRRIEQAAFVP
jgi:putative phosphoesterase